jgi:hypothetical protein
MMVVVEMMVVVVVENTEMNRYNIDLFKQSSKSIQIMSCLNYNF